MSNLAKKVLYSVLGSEDAVTVALEEDGASIWLSSRERDGAGCCSSRLRGELWGRLVSNNRRLSLDCNNMMMMMSTNLFTQVINSLRLHLSENTEAWSK